MTAPRFRQARPHTPGMPAWGDTPDGNDGWRQSAACRAVGPGLFFAAGSARAASRESDEALQVCASCPVQARCLEFALATNQEFGVWGGLTETARRQLRSRRAASPGAGAEVR